MALGGELPEERRFNGLAEGVAPAKKRETSWFPDDTFAAFLGGILIMIN